MLEPEQVVSEALAALGYHPFVVPGLFNRTAAFLLRHFLSRRATVTVMGSQTRRLLLRRPTTPSPP
jgi:hypothetical protein